MTPQKRREMERDIHRQLVDILTKDKDDEEFFISLLIANQFIANELSRFDDAFDEN